MNFSFFKNRFLSISLLFLLGISSASCTKSFPDSNWLDFLLLDDSLSLFGSGSGAGSTTIGASGTKVLFNKTSVFTFEDGAVAADSFTVQLEQNPSSGTVDFTITSSDTTEALISQVSNAGPWLTAENISLSNTVPVTIYVQGQNVADGTDGNISYTLTTSNIAATDTYFNGFNPLDVSGINMDVDTAGAAGIVASPSTGLFTTENGDTAQFAVLLTKAPAAAQNATISVSSTLVTEATVAPAVLTFDNVCPGANCWYTPRVVTVTGVNDFVIDANTPYNVQLNPATSSDPAYSILGTTNVIMFNKDNDAAGVTASVGSLVVSETGTTGIFTVVLNSQPQGASTVTIDVTSSNTAEGIVAPASLLFDGTCPGVNCWSVPKTVTVTGVDDLVADGSVIYPVNLAFNVLGTTDINYTSPPLALPSVSVTTTDNETAGITVSTGSVAVSETGTTATFNIVLNTPPMNPVTIALNSSDTTEAIIDTPSMTFNTICPSATCWSTAHTVTVTGVDDFLADGNVNSSIITQPAVSFDPAYNNKNAADVTVTTSDNDTAGFTVWDPNTAGYSIAENAGTDLTTIVLNTQPNANVVIPVVLTSSKPGHELMTVDLGVTWVSSGTPVNITFTPANWYISQAIVVTSVPDTTMEKTFGGADPTFTVAINAFTGLDTTGYVGLNPADYSGVNKEDEKFIFSTTTTHNGDFDNDAALNGGAWSAVNGDFFGIPEADNFCMGVANGYPGAGKFKAMLSDSWTRQASNQPDVGDFQIDWVFKPNTNYYRNDLAFIMQTNGVSLFNFGTGTLSVPFDTAASVHWTGLFGSGWDWWINHCLNWSDGTGIEQGDFGRGNFTDGTSLVAPTSPGFCNVPRKVICVEQ